MENMTNYQLITMYKRLLRDGLLKFALPLQEEIFMRMSDEQASHRPVLSVIKGGIA